MAKRKRLTLPNETMDDDPLASPPPYEKKSWDPSNEGAQSQVFGQATAPISAVAADISAHAALNQLAETLSEARREGRLLQALPLDVIEADYLVRDRVVVDEDEMQSLVDSIRLHGQRHPIEVTKINNGSFGLISGWRRLKALQILRQESPERFGTILAILRQPEQASDAYIAMVEENEIRQGLSYYERARIVAQSADLGVFVSEKKALQSLFAASSRAKRSKIGSFLDIYRKLDGALKFPFAIPERLGLQVSKAIESHEQSNALLKILHAAMISTAEQELEALTRFVKNQSPARPVPNTAATTPSQAEEIMPGLFWTVSLQHSYPKVTLSGAALEEPLLMQLKEWLKNQRSQSSPGSNKPV